MDWQTGRQAGIIGTVKDNHRVCIWMDLSEHSYLVITDYKKKLYPGGGQAFCKVGISDISTVKPSRDRLISSFSIERFQ